MELSDGFRRRLWCSEDWDKTVAELQAETIAMADPWQRGARLFQIGLLAEGLVPDAQTVIRIYEKAWKATGDHRRALVRSRYLCRELLRLDTAARLLEIEADHFDESSLHVQATFAWIDAGQRPEAEAALAAATAKRPGDPKVTQARKVLSRPNVAEEVAVLERQAMAAESSDPPGAAQQYLQAARRLRLGTNPGDPAQALRFLRKAFALDARDEAIATLLEIAAGTAWNPGEFLAFTERRVAVAESDHERVDVLRRSGVALVQRLGQPAQGAALLERALQLGYEQRLAQVPRHGATIRVLAETLAASGETTRFLDLIDRGLAAASSDDDALYLAIQGHQASHKAGDHQRAARYASRIEALEPSHPLAAKRAQALDMIEVDQVGVVVAPPPPPPAALRAKPASSASSPVIAKLLSRRKSERAEFHEALVVKCSAQLEVKRAGGAASSMVNASARDISRGGVFVLSEGLFLTDEHLEITVMIPGDEEWSLDTFKVRAQVARIDPGVGVGCRFVEPTAEFLAAVDKLIAARGVKT